MSELIRMEHITKRFPGVTANENVTLVFDRGEVHALLGENGAGKTTIMNVLYGLLHADEGRILVEGKPAAINSPNDAIAYGIGMVHQHFMLIPKFTVAENVVLGTRIAKQPFLDLGPARERIREISRSTGLNIDPDAKVSELSIGDQQRVEIIKAIYKGARVLIMDEPTSVLTPQEVDELFTVLRAWVAQGNTVIFITHKMREVMEVCDRISILRNGKYIATVRTKDTNPDEVAQMMVGRQVSLEMEKGDRKPGAVILNVKSLVVNDAQNIPAVREVSLQVREGEIVGIAGVDGNGQLELVEAIMGLRHSQNGEITFEGESIRGLAPNQILARGISNIPFRRQTEGLVLDFSVQENLILKERNKSPFAKHRLLNPKAIRENAKRCIDTYRIKAKGPMTRAGNMSGGNQQKIVVARELERKPKLLIACHPTHGLDIGAIEFIHKQILEQRQQGTGVLLISTELDELFQLSDRILVMYKGAVMGAVIPGEAALRQVGLMMLGTRLEDIAR